MTRKLTNKQTRFVEEYAIDLNATAAARRSGYSDPNFGRQLLTKPNVQEAIAKIQRELSEKLTITRERVINEIAKVAFFDIGEIFDEAGNLLHPDQIPENARQALASIETSNITEGKGDNATPVTVRKIRFHDKLKALEQLGRHLGLFVERHEHSGPGGGPIETKITDFPPEPKTIAEWVKQREEAEALRLTQESEK